MPSKNSLTKPVRSGTPFLFDSCLPPSIKGENGPNPRLVLQFGRDGKLTEFSCSKELYERVDGAAQESTAHTGYDNLRDYHFVVWEKDGEALHVDRINMRMVSLPQKNSVDPDKPLPKIKGEIEVDTGDVHLREVPNGVRGAQLFPLVVAIGRLKTLKKGTAIVAGFKFDGLDDDGNIEISYPRSGVKPSSTPTVR